MADETEEHLLPEFDVHLQAFSIAAAEGEAAATAYRLRQLRTVVAAEGGASRRRHPLPNIYWGQDATEQLKAAHREIVGHCASSASQLQPLAVRQLRTALEDDTAAAATAAAAAAAAAAAVVAAAAVAAVASVVTAPLPSPSSVANRTG